MAPSRCATPSAWRSGGAPNDFQPYSQRTKVRTVVTFASFPCPFGARPTLQPGLVRRTIRSAFPGGGASASILIPFRGRPVRYQGREHIEGAGGGRDQDGLGRAPSNVRHPQVWLARPRHTSLQGKVSQWDPDAFLMNPVFPIYSLWVSERFPMGFLWVPYLFPTGFLRNPYGFPMESLWFAYGIPIDSL